MATVKQIAGGLWMFSVVLPDSPLKQLNCYAVKGTHGGRNLLVDTGFSRPECRRELDEAMHMLGLEPENTDVFITHLHSDHVGNAAYLSGCGCRIVMGQTDYLLQCNGMESCWSRNTAKLNTEGLPVDTLEMIKRNNRTAMHTSGTFTAEFVNGSELLPYGDYRLEVIHTPGHTPGHMCLYDAASKTLFCGDHVLSKISPTVSSWPCMTDSVGVYMNSLEAVSRLAVTQALAAHGEILGANFYETIDRLLQHHRRRLDDAELIVKENPGLNAYEISGRMRWRIKADGWDSFPPEQKYFATGETLAHLEHLLAQGRIVKVYKDSGMPGYVIA